MQLKPDKLDELIPRQRYSLWLDGHAGLFTPEDAVQFMQQVALALRYGATPDVLLAALRRLVSDPQLSSAARKALEFITANQDAARPRVLGGACFTLPNKAIRTGCWRIGRSDIILLRSR